MKAGRQGNGITLQDQMLKYELIEGLQRAIDDCYRRVRRTARQEWESRFAGNDPSDACISIRIDSIPAEASMTALPCAGYFSKALRPHHGQTRARLA